MNNARSCFSLGVDTSVVEQATGRRKSRSLAALSSAVSARRNGLSFVVIGLMAAAFPQELSAQAPDLGTAANFAVLAGSIVTNTGSSVLIGSLGVSPGNAVTGFPPGIVASPGAIHVGDAVAVQAQIDLVTATTLWLAGQLPLI